jgi:uncharacterized protein
MDVKHTQNEEKGTFFIEENRNQIAWMTYTFAGKDKFIIDHTVLSFCQKHF